MIPNWRAAVYAILCIPGVVVPWFFNLQHYSAGGTTAEFLSLGFVNPVAASLTSDLVVGSAAFVVWMIVEARRLEMRWWIYLLATFGVAFAFSAPLFLWMRERRLSEPS